MGSSILALPSPLSPTQVGPSPPHPILIWPPCAWPAPEYTLPDDLSWAVRGSMGLPRPGSAGSCREIPKKGTWRWGSSGEKPGWESGYEPGSGSLLGRVPGRPVSPTVRPVNSFVHGPGLVSGLLCLLSLGTCPFPTVWTSVFLICECGWKDGISGGHKVVKSAKDLSLCK